MVVLVVVPNLANPVFAEVIRGIDDELVAAGYDMIIGNLDNLVEREARYVDLCTSGQVDGVLLLTGRVPVGHGGRSMVDTGVPMVALCAAIPELAGPSVVVDDRLASGRVARHLVGLGHRRFGYARGPEGNFNEIHRFAGFTAELEACGIAADTVRTWPGLFDMKSGVAVGKAFLELAAEARPTAVFLACDALAIGFMKTVMTAGVRVPEDVSVVGFDGIDYAEFYQPALTTIRQPRHEIGRRGTSLLLARLRDGGAALPEGMVEVAAEFVPGASTAPPGGTTV
jgi:LacI family repressor for deo operon, udp, cdd, tsx, nupC, and nupG